MWKTEDKNDIIVENKGQKKGVIMEIVRKNIIFKGRVQGVGFRYRATYAARGLRVTGWGQNLPDGCVEMEAQGNEAQINRMLAMIQKDSYIRIDRMEITDIELQDQERGFRVKGY